MERWKASIFILHSWPELSIHFLTTHSFELQVQSPCGLAQVLFYEYPSNRQLYSKRFTFFSSVVGWSWTQQGWIWTSTFAFYLIHGLFSMHLRLCLRLDASLAHSIHITYLLTTCLPQNIHAQLWHPKHFLTSTTAFGCFSLVWLLPIFSLWNGRHQKWMGSE